MNQAVLKSKSSIFPNRKISRECTCEIIYSPRSKHGSQGSMCDVCSEKLFSRSLNSLSTDLPNSDIKNCK